MEQLARLPARFVKDGVVTPGNRKRHHGRRGKRWS